MQYAKCFRIAKFIWFSWFVRIINAYQCFFTLYIYYLMKWTGDWDMKKSILLDAWIPFILLFLKNCYGRFKINTRCYTCREQILQKKWLCVKKMTGRRIKIVLKFHIFNANKGLGFWLENRCSRKVLKGLL